MSWATQYIADLQNGKTVQFRPKGNSMVPLINSGDKVTVEPVLISALSKGDIVLCKVNGYQYLHLVNAIGTDGRVQIANNRGRINGWTRTVFGKVIGIEK